MFKQIKLPKLIILLSLLVFTGLLQTGTITIPNKVLAMLLTLIFLFALPGFLILELFFESVQFSGVEKLCLSFLLGIMLLLAPATLLLVWHFSLQALNLISFTLTLILACSYGIFCIKIGDPPQPLLSTNPKKNSFIFHDSKNEVFLLYLGLGLFIASMIYLFITMPIIETWGDSWTYLAYINKYLTGPFNSVDTFHPAVDARVARNGWLVVLALMSKVANVHPLELFSIYLPPILAILSILSFYTLAKALFHNRTVALFSTLIHLVYLASTMTPNLGGLRPGTGLATFLRISEDKFFAIFVLLPVALALMLRYFESGQFRYLILFVLSTIALSVTHPISYALLGLAFGAFVIVQALTSVDSLVDSCRPLPHLTTVIRRSWQFIRCHQTILIRAVILAIALIIVAFIPLEARLVLHQSGNTAFEPEAKDYFDFELFKYRHLILFESGQYMANLNLLARPMIVLALGLTPLLLIGIRHKLAAQFLLSNMLIPLAIIYNPWTAPILGSLITPWLIWRVGFMLPISLTIGYVLYQFIEWLRGQLIQKFRVAPKSFLLTALPLFILLILLISVFPQIIRGFHYRQKQHNLYTLSPEKQDMLEHIGPLIKPDSVILADVTTNQYLPTFVTGARTLTFRDWELDDQVADDIARFYRARSINEFAVALLNQYNVRYIILENRLPLTTQLSLLPSMFAERYQDDIYTVFEVSPHLRSNALTAANTHLDQGHWAGAINRYEQILTVDAHNLPARFGLARAYQGQKAVDQAIAQYKQIIKLRPDLVWPYLYLAESYMLKGELTHRVEVYQKSADIYHQIFEREPMNRLVQDALLDGYLILGEQYFQRAFSTKLVKAYQASIQTEPYNLELYQDLARFHLIRGHPDEAIKVYHHALTTWPAWAEAYIQLGQAYETQGDDQAAQEAYQTALDLEPTFPSAYLRLGNLYQKESDDVQKISLYKSAVRQNPTLAWPYLNLGRAHLVQAIKD